MKTLEIEKTFQLDKRTFLDLICGFVQFENKPIKVANNFPNRISFSSVIHCNCQSNKLHYKQILKFQTSKGFWKCKYVIKENEKSSKENICVNHVEEKVFHSLNELGKSDLLENIIIDAVFIKKKLTVIFDDDLKISFDELQTYPDKEKLYFAEVEGKKSKIIDFCKMYKLDELPLSTRSKFTYCQKLNIRVDNIETISTLLSNVKIDDFEPCFYEFCPTNNKMNVEREIKIKLDNFERCKNRILKVLGSNFNVLSDNNYSKVDYYFDTENFDFKNSDISYRFQYDKNIANINFKLPIDSKEEYVIRNEYKSKFYARTMDEILSKKCYANIHLSHYLHSIGLDIDEIAETLLIKSVRNVYFVYLDDTISPESLIGILFFDDLKAKKNNGKTEICFSMCEFEFYDSFLTIDKIKAQRKVEDIFLSFGLLTKSNKYTMAFDIMDNSK